MLFSLEFFLFDQGVVGSETFKTGQGDFLSFLSLIRSKVMELEIDLLQLKWIFFHRVLIIMLKTAERTSFLILPSVNAKILNFVIGCSLRFP